MCEDVEIGMAKLGPPVDSVHYFRVCNLQDLTV